MPSPIVHCENCGLVFQSQAFRFEGSIGVTLVGNTESCPRCGKDARFLDGEFDFLDNAIKVLKAPQRTIDVIEALQQALRAAQAGKTEDEVVAPLEKAAPEIAATSRNIAKKGGLGLLAAILLATLAQCASNTHTTLDINRLFDQVYAAISGKPLISTPQKLQPNSPSEQKEPLSRQQRRLQERQTKKLQQSNARQNQSRPKG